MRILITAAHPDDETFGMGGTIARHIDAGDNICLVVFTDGVLARHDKTTEQANALIEAASIYGIQRLIHLQFENQKLDVVPLLYMTRELETILKTFPAERVYTHSYSDVNQDHRRVYEAVSVISRPVPGQTIKTVISFPTASSTEWSIAHDKFTPNLFVDVSKFIGIKIEAMKPYEKTFISEVKPYPHPRSYNGILQEAARIGSMVGADGYYEAFELLRSIER